MSPAHRGRFVAYYRVSTDRQGRSGLGLEAQKAAVAARLNGGTWELVEEHVEVESGRKADRPQLAAALAACKRHKAKLVVAKLDRLSRNTAFLLTLLDSGVDVLFADLPDVTGPMGRFLLTTMVSVAELEAGLISERTKAALAAAKARGVKLGAPAETLVQARANSRRRIVEDADRYARDVVMPVIERIQKGGTTSFNGIANELTERGIRTRRGGHWSANAVKRILLRGVA
jgi:DNA invertase Pin-like site-specific DNA recombinase